MRGSAIRHVKCAETRPLVAMAMVDSLIQIWDIMERTKLSEFDSVLGGSRLALSADGALAVGSRHMIPLPVSSFGSGPIYVRRNTYRLALRAKHSGAFRTRTVQGRYPFSMATTSAD